MYGKAENGKWVPELSSRKYNHLSFSLGYIHVAVRDVQAAKTIAQPAYFCSLDMRGNIS
jgi:hypothetical protein